MNINQLKLTNTLDRSVFTIESHRKANNEILALSNRQLIFEWIKQQGGQPYIDKQDGAVLIRSYNQLAKELIKSSVLKIFIVHIQPFGQMNYTITKLPLLRKL
jgi:hypothetical protein